MNPVVLVGCSKKKLTVAAPARSFYTGGLFKLSVAYAGAHGLEWVVLSTEHGVLGPDDRVSPYSRSFSRSAIAYAGEDEEAAHADEAYRAEWGRKVNAELKRRFPGRRFVSLVGRWYESGLDGLEVERPLAGMRIGQRLAELCRLGRPKQEEMWTT